MRTTRSREKYATPECIATNSKDDQQISEGCGFLEKVSNYEVCEEYAAMECRVERYDARDGLLPSEVQIFGGPS
jgi:hypothetical protein